MEEILEFLLKAYICMSISNLTFTQFITNRLTDKAYNDSIRHLKNRKLSSKSLQILDETRREKDLLEIKELIKSLIPFYRLYNTSINFAFRRENYMEDLRFYKNAHRQIDIIEGIDTKTIKRNKKHKVLKYKSKDNKNH